MESSPNDGKEEKIGGKESDGVENERGNPHMKKKGFPQGFIFPHTITSFGEDLFPSRQDYDQQQHSHYKGKWMLIGRILSYRK